MLPDVINGQAHCLYVRYFAGIFLLIVQLKLHQIRDVCTLYVGALV